LLKLLSFDMVFSGVHRILYDYVAQRRAVIYTPVFDSSQFPVLYLDRNAWTANPTRQSTQYAEAAARPVPE
ncbi:sodium:alanine symporter, partial [Pseudomonas syringae pv. tagetis]